MNKRIGIFGGSFDPVHRGHIEAVQSFLNSELLDEVWVLLTPEPPHKSGETQTEWSHRLNMLKLAFDDMERVDISTIERDLPQPSYSHQTIEHLQQEYPDHTFFLCLGEDSIQYFDTWHRYRDILDLVSLIAVNRPGSDASGVNPGVLERTIFTGHRPLDLSSTGIRQQRQSDDHIKPTQLPERVDRYIREHNLYRSNQS